MINYLYLAVVPQMSDKCKAVLRKRLWTTTDISDFWRTTIYLNDLLCPLRRWTTGLMLRAQPPSLWSPLKNVRPMLILVTARGSLWQCTIGTGGSYHLELRWLLGNSITTENAVIEEFTWQNVDIVNLVVPFSALPIELFSLFVWKHWKTAVNWKHEIFRVPVARVRSSKESGSDYWMLWNKIFV